MIAKLSREASGLRHLRWAREIAGALEAHLAHGRFDAEGRAALEGALGRWRTALGELSAAVKAYRDFLERRRTELTGAVRAGRHWQVDCAPALAEIDARERAPLRSAVRRAVEALHATEEAIAADLEARFDAAFVASLYPEVSATAPAGRVLDHVVGDGDPDDDAAW
jgi:hypothetical protein